LRSREDRHKEEIGNGRSREKLKGRNIKERGVLLIQEICANLVSLRR